MKRRTSLTDAPLVHHDERSTTTHYRCVNCNDHAYFQTRPGEAIPKVLPTVNLCDEFNDTTTCVFKPGKPPAGDGQKFALHDHVPAEEIPQEHIDPTVSGD